MAENEQKPDFAGYQDLNGLVQGYRASSQEGQRQKQRADQLEQQAIALQQQLQQMQQMAQPTPRPAPNVRTRLTEVGMPVDDLQEFVNEVAGQILRPIVGLGTARQRMLAQYGDEYAKFEPQTYSYINSDPSLAARHQRMLEADPESAAEWAFAKFSDHQRRQAGSPQNGAIQQAQAEATIPTQRSPENRNQQEPDHVEARRKAWEHYTKTGDPAAYANQRFAEVIAKFKDLG